MTTFRNALAKVFVDASEEGHVCAWQEVLSFVSEGTAERWMERMRANDVRCARREGTQIIIEMHNETDGIVDELRCIDLIVRDGLNAGLALEGMRYRVDYIL